MIALASRLLMSRPQVSAGLMWVKRNLFRRSALGAVPIVRQIDGHQGKYTAASHSCVMTKSSSVRCEMLEAIPQLRAVALALCRNADRADDLVQETLLRGCS